MLVTKSAIRPGSNFNRQGGSIFHQRQHTIAHALDSQERTGVERLRDSGRLGYQAATYKAPVGSNGISEALQNFGANAARLYGSYKEGQKSQADERSNEIIRKLTPEQRRQAVASGTLLYQDDPDAMEALRFKSGRNAAFEVETEIKQKITEGTFKSQQELMEYRKTRMEDKSKSYAEAVGIDSADQHYQRGFNADIVQREAAIYDDHARKLSEQTQAIAQMETVSDLGSMFSDEGFLRSETAAGDFASYFSASLAKGSIPTETMAVSVLQESLAQNASQPGADVFFKNIGDQEVTLYGRPMKIRDIVGPEVLENYQVKSGEAAFNRNRELTQQFTFGIQDALAQTDPHAGLAKLAQIQGAVYKIQDTNVVTPQTEALNAARGRLLAQIGADSQKRTEAMDKQIKADNKALLFETKYAQRIAGDNVSTDWRTYETNQDTGDFKDEDAANFAIKKLNELDRMSLTPEERDKQKLSYLRADFADGPFRKHFQTLTADAVGQFNGLVAAESAVVTEETTGRIRDFQRIYQSDPATISALYPEEAAMAERLALMERHGIGLETIVDADRRKKGLTQEERMLQENKWSALLASTTSAVPFLPTPIRSAARTLYDSELYRTGDESAALATVDSWLEKSTVTFKSQVVSYREGNYTRPKVNGVIQKRTLMVDPQDATSWRKGQEIIHEVVRELAKGRPWLTEDDISFTETPNGIVLSDPLSSIHLAPITAAYLQQHYQWQQAQARRGAVELRSQAADEKIGAYKAEQERRKQSPFGDLDPSTGTLESAAGFRDR